MPRYVTVAKVETTIRPESGSVLALRRAIAAALLLLPILYVLLWHLCNHGIPNDDAANYAETAMRITEHFQHGGIVSGLVAMVGTRGWRPIAFPPLAVPFLLLTGNDVAAGCAATLLLLYLALTFYLYRLARLCSADPLCAAAAVAFVVSSPMVITFAVRFFAESAWLLFSVACVYHLVKSGPFQMPLEGALSGLYAALMMAIRPTESAVMLAILIVFAGWVAIRAKRLQFRSSLVVAGVFFLPLLLLLLSAWHPAISRFDIWSVCIAALFGSLILARRHNRSLLAFLAIFTGGVCFWWAAYMPALFAWAYDASFGKMAQITDKQPFSRFGGTLLRILGAFGDPQLLLVGGSALVVLFAAAVNWKRQPVQVRRNWAPATPATFLLYASSIAILAFILLYAGSGTDDPRRILVALALLMTTVIAVAAGRSRLVLAGVLCVVLGEFVAIGRNLAGAPARAAAKEFPVLPAPYRQPDGNLETARLLARYVPPGNVVAVYTNALFQPDARIYEPAALKLASLEVGNGLEDGYLWDTADYGEVVQRLRNNRYKYLLLDSWPTTGPKGKRMPYVHFTSDLLQRMRKGAETPGLQLLTRFDLRGREQMLFRILPARPPNAPDNVAGVWNGARAIASEEQTGFPASNLNDGSDAAWGSREGKANVYAGVVLPRPLAVHEIRLRLFTPNGRPHLHNIRIVTADGDGLRAPTWQFVRARIKGSKAFISVLTVPAMPDDTTIVVELDPSDPHWRPHSTWGFACLRSKGDVPNYLPRGFGIYVREVEFE